jgi:hypothetical protein
MDIRRTSGHAKESIKAIPAVINHMGGSVFSKAALKLPSNISISPAKIIG